MTEPDPSRRRSRFAWPRQTEPTTTPAGTHSHRQSNGPLLIAYVALVLLLATNAALAYFVWQDHQYVVGRGEYRDAESARIEQSITDAVCDLLDQLPEGGLLERPRAKYGCGPGIPISEFPPEVQEQFRGDVAPPPPPEDPAWPNTGSAPNTSAPDRGAP